jgi:multicomponent Na+:H+ antiporter subunit E
MFTFNIVLAFIWVVLNNSFTLADVIVGLLFGFLAIRLSWPVLSSEPFSFGRFFSLGKRNPIVLTGMWIRFIIFGFIEVVKSNIAVVKVVLAPKMKLNPGIVAIPLDIKSDAGITTLANVITLTPGTVSLDVSSDRKTLYIHAFNVTDADADALRRETKETFERRVQELLP